jgi:hypothetical protein
MASYSLRKTPLDLKTGSRQSVNHLTGDSVPQGEKKCIVY